MTSALLNADTPSLLNHEIDDLLLHMRGLAVVRDILSSRGASSAEIIGSHPRARVRPLAADRADQRLVVAPELPSARTLRCVRSRRHQAFFGAFADLQASCTAVARRSTPKSLRRCDSSAARATRTPT